jgi:hypothetical protein
MAWIMNFAAKVYHGIAGEVELEELEASEESEGPDSPSPKSSAPALTSWHPGQAVRLANLQSQRQLNGQAATVMRQDPEKGKWVVRLEKDAKEVGLGCLLFRHGFLDTFGYSRLCVLACPLINLYNRVSQSYIHFFFYSRCFSL